MILANCVIAACLVFLFMDGAVAQDRMPPIPKEQMTEAQKKAADELVAGPRGTLAGDRKSVV